MSWPLERTVLWLTWRQLFAKKRIYAAVAFALLPLLFSFVFRFNSTGTEGETVGYFDFMTAQLIIGTLLPLAAAVFGTTAFGGEVDDGTLVYLLVKPIDRWRVVLSKYVVAVLASFIVIVPAVLLPWLVLREEGSGAGFVVGYLTGNAAGPLL